MAATTPSAPTGHPPAFARAVAALLATRLRPEVTVEETPAPHRLAPHAAALHAEARIGDEELASGRLVVLHDPGRPEAWGGDTRLVAYARATVEPEMAGDPLLPSVVWAWLTEALAAAEAPYLALGGTITLVSSQRFGALAGGADAAEVELRGSWTATSLELRPHLSAFAELLCAAAGLPPSAPGVLLLPRRRRR